MKTFIYVLLFGYFFWIVGCASQEVPPAVEPPVEETGEVVEQETGEVIEPTEEAAATEDKLDLAPILFDFDKSFIKEEAKPILEAKAIYLNDHKNVKIQIEGHCDERGSNQYNLALGERRAHSTKEYLIYLGVNAGQLSTISYGEERPVDSRSNREAWTKNRRSEFVVLKGL